jgi:hypothetical protein
VYPVSEFTEGCLSFAATKDCKKSKDSTSPSNVFTGKQSKTCGTKKSIFSITITKPATVSGAKIRAECCAGK